jgi:hypothetical protein
MLACHHSQEIAAAWLIVPPLLLAIADEVIE